MRVSGKEGLEIIYVRRNTHYISRTLELLYDVYSQIRGNEAVCWPVEAAVLCRRCFRMMMMQ